MGWMIGIVCYAALLMGVLLLAGGRRRGDLRHAEAINDLAALDGRFAKDFAPARRAMRRVRSAPERSAEHATPLS